VFVIYNNKDLSIKKKMNASELLNRLSSELSELNKSLIGLFDESIKSLEKPLLGSWDKFEFEFEFNIMRRGLESLNEPIGSFNERIKSSDRWKNREIHFLILARDCLKIPAAPVEQSFSQSSDLIISERSDGKFEVWKNFWKHFWNGWEPNESSELNELNKLIELIYKLKLLNGPIDKLNESCNLWKAYRIKKSKSSNVLKKLLGILETCCINCKEIKINELIGELKVLKSSNKSNLKEVFELYPQINELLNKLRSCDSCKERNIETLVNEFGDKEIIKFLHKRKERNIEWIDFNEFSNINYLTKGGFGIIYKATWNYYYRDKKVVLKKLYNSKNKITVILNEVKYTFFL